MNTRHMQSILVASLIELAALCWHSSGGNVCTQYRLARLLQSWERDAGQATSEAADYQWPLFIYLDEQRS